MQTGSWISDERMVEGKIDDAQVHALGMASVSGWRMLDAMLNIWSKVKRIV